ncbi:MAG TPA: hypothetical protein VMM18_13365 [Gemmatimonadaceae bacterium]|nr:hypothetical protein [Gemmatimonadaceae bacterium]
MWSFLAVLGGLAFPALAVWIRRRFDTEELIAASAGGIVLQGALVALAGWNQEHFPGAPFFGAMALGTIATAFAIDRLAGRSTTPDTLLEAVAGYVAFVAGAVIGLTIGFLFMLRGSGWTG